jgi:hypothetical protein
VGDGQVWPFPEHLANHHQTWLREPATGRYRLDVFREPHVGDYWVCRRDASITLPYNELILRSSEGIPYAAPEVALLFKAKHLREKDIADFQRVLPTMEVVTILRSEVTQATLVTTPAACVVPQRGPTCGTTFQIGAWPPASDSSG